MKYRFEKEFRTAHPETLGETDAEFDLDNYKDWLEDEYCKILLNQANVDNTRTEPALPIQSVSNSASSCSFNEVKDIWNAAEKHVLHEMGKICKGDANYEEDTPDLNTYYERHYY